MLSSIASSQRVIPLNSILSHQETGTGQYESRNKHNARKRHRSGSLGYGMESENNVTDDVSSMSATIDALSKQVLYLQRLLRDAYAPLHLTSTRHTCPARSCRKTFKLVEHLYRHIRDQNNPVHEALAGLINETRCLACAKTFCRSTDLVKHERKIHGETYISRLDKFMGTSLPLLPPSSSSVAVGDVQSRTRSTLKANHRSSSHRAPCPPSDQTGSSIGAVGIQPSQHINAIGSADDASVPELLGNGQGLTTHPSVMRPEAINTDFWAARSGISSTFKNDTASDPYGFTLSGSNQPSDQPDHLLGPESWDRFYVDGNGVMQNTREKWDSFYVVENGVVQNTWMEGWDEFYLDKQENENCGN